MKRKPPLRLHLVGTLLALLLAGLSSLSCEKRGAILEPSKTALGFRGALNGPPLNNEIVPTEAVVTLVPGASINDFTTAHQLTLVSTLDLPAVGATPAQTYYLVHTNDNSTLNIQNFGFDARVNSMNEHNRVWMPEDDRGGLSFDDNHTWRLGGDYLSQPAIGKVKIPQSRNITEGLGETIAILDTGVDTQHPLFTAAHARFGSGGNYTVFPPTTGISDTGNHQDDDLDGVPDDGVGHGTHVAGIVFTGARKATFIVFKVLDDEGRGTVFGLAKAIKAAADMNVKAINLSLGLRVDDTMLRHVIDHCADKGIAVVASAGNRGSDEIQYPAAYDDVVSVAAVDNQDVRPDFASYGSTVDISAPGVDVISPIPAYFGPGKYAVASGSSMATPWVTSLVALLHARHPEMTPRDMIPNVVGGADDIATQNPTFPGLLGTGRVDFLSSLTTPFIAE